MAIQSLPKLIPISNLGYHTTDKERTYKSGFKTVYVRDCEKRKEDPTQLIKWCRRNFGERGVGWDFQFISGCVTIEFWEDKYITMYEMWKN
jgi:hypothetical protein